MLAAVGKIERPLPWDFHDYREYLCVMIEYLGATRKSFSIRQFSRKTGYASPNYLRLVADGKRNLSHASIARFAAGLGLTEEEHDGFEALVHLGRASNDDERNRYYEKLSHHGRHHSPTRQLEQAQFEVYSSWFVLPVREMLLLPDFEEDPYWISRRLRPSITHAQATRALELLQQTGLAVRDESGCLRPADIKLATPPSVQSLGVRNYHRALLKLSASALDRLPVDSRNITSVTVCLGKRQYELVSKRIEALRLELLDLIEDDPDDGEDREVHLLGFQVVPLSRKEKK